MDIEKDRALQHLQALCNRAPDRSVGSGGNRAATNYFTRTLESLGWEVTLGTFECQDWDSEGARLQGPGSPRAIFPSPYGRGCSLEASLAVASSVEELEEVDLSGKILLLKGAVAASPLIPKNYPFYRPEEHQRIYRALEKASPAAILTATAWNPALSGALYPCPMIEDGDFNIPSAYLSAADGDMLSAQEGLNFSLTIRCRRLPSRGSNVCAHRGDPSGPKLVFCAHIDSKKGSPGAMDNATGVAVLMLLAEQLKDYSGPASVELVAFNGEDYYSAPGQVLYLEGKKDELEKVSLAVNIDGVGLREENQAYSFYAVPPAQEPQLRKFLSSFPDLKEGPHWPQGDHMIFAQRQVPSVALTCTNAQSRLTYHIAHTPDDTVDLADPEKLAVLARTLADLVRKFPF